MPDDQESEETRDGVSELEQERMIEAILFASAEPVTLHELRLRLPDEFDVAVALSRLKNHYSVRGFRLVRVGDAWAFRTAPDLAHLLRKERIAKKRFSRAALETMAIIAYHQPATRAEIEEIRGVTVSRGTLDQLIDAGWVGLGRRRKSPGRPATFVTTRKFLDHFGLESVQDLPGLRELMESGLLESFHHENIDKGDRSGESFPDQ